MKKILITGATGNVGFEVIRFLYEINTTYQIVAGVRNLEKAKEVFADYPKLEYVYFDFENADTFETSLKGIDRIFLLRPPDISDVDKFIRPFIIQMKKMNVEEIIFLSVQGAEKSRVIPHNKIERLINEFELNYIFLRPAYFMQNLTTTLLGDIKTKRGVFLPAGKARFNWIDIENIGEAGAILLNRFEEYKNQTFEITGSENKSFEKVICLINAVTQKPVRYINMNPFKFYRMKKREGMVRGMIIVLILLHFLPRFQKEPAISDFFERLTGKKPTDLKTFIDREKDKFEKIESIKSFIL